MQRRLLLQRPAKSVHRSFLLQCLIATQGGMYPSFLLQCLGLSPSFLLQCLAVIQGGMYPSFLLQCLATDPSFLLQCLPRSPLTISPMTHHRFPGEL